MKKHTYIISFLILFLGLPICVQAQEEGFEMIIENNQPDFVFNTIADYENGVNYPGAVRFTIKAKKKDDWSIYARAQESSFSAGGYTMPLNVLKIQVQGFAARYLSNTDQLLASERPTNSEYETKSYLIDYAVAAPGYNYVAGAYTCTVIYTLTVK